MQEFRLQYKQSTFSGRFNSTISKFKMLKRLDGGHVYTLHKNNKFNANDFNKLN